MEVSSNWISEEINIADCVKVHTDDLPDALSELLDEDGGIVLSAPKLNKEQCFLQLNSPPSSKGDGACIGNPIEQLKRALNSHASEESSITSVTVISESKLIEVFVGKHGEYLGSFPSTLVEQLPDSPICRTVINLSKPQSSIKLVFKNIYDDTSLMVFGVFVKKAPEVSDGQFPSTTRFSSNHLDSVLSEHGVTTLSKEASMFKRVLQQYNDNSREASAAASSSFPFSSLLPLLGASGSGGPAMLGNLAAMVQKQYPPSGASQFQMQMTNPEERSEKKFGSGTDLVTPDGNTNNSKSLNLSNPLNFNLPHTQVPQPISHLRKPGIEPEQSLCDGVTRMDISPENDSHHSTSSLSSCGSETQTPNHLLQQSSDVTLENIPQDSSQVINSLSARTCGQAINVNELQGNGINSHLNEHFIGVFESIMDKKLAAFEKRIETMVSQKLAETSAQIFSKLNRIELALDTVPGRESSNNTS